MNLSNEVKKSQEKRLPKICIYTRLLVFWRRALFSMFIAKKDSPEEYRNRVSWMNVTLNQAASLTLKDDTLAGIVVNAFTEPFIITRDLL